MTAAALVRPARDHGARGSRARRNCPRDGEGWASFPRDQRRDRSLDLGHEKDWGMIEWDMQTHIVL